MNTSLILLAALLLVIPLAIFIAIQKMTAGGNLSARPVQLGRTRSVLTVNEQGMYFRLVDALPQAVVLAQVAHSALLTAKGYAARNTFDRKRADFVLCDRAFQVLAVIELDDSSDDTNGDKDKDKARDAALAGVGYRVVRYRDIPDIDRVRADFPSTEVGGEMNAKTQVVF